jgi:hypothetical protein
MKKLLLTLLISAPAYAQELTLYFVPSPSGIDWTSPSSLLTSSAKNKLTFKKHFMGHAWVELKCDNVHEVTGMVADSPDYMNQIIVNQIGLGVLFHSFKGKLESKADIQKELDHYKSEGGMNFVSFKLNRPQCKRAITYLNEYRKFNIARYYGLAQSPRQAEGAGCSAFAVSFPDVLNILEQDMKESWIQTVHIPLELTGAPLGDDSVSLLKILRRDSWATGMEPHKKLTFWDPDKMYQWVKKKAAERSVYYSAEQRGKVSGLIYDKSHYPVPEEPIWSQQLDPKDKKKTVIIVEPTRPPKKNLPK